jgi:hypothetical protein
LPIALEAAKACQCAGLEFDAVRFDGPPACCWCYVLRATAWHCRIARYAL